MSDAATDVLARLPLDGAVEIVLLDGSAAATEPGLRLDPGHSMERASATRHLAPLAIAPGRWLWLNADADETAGKLGASACVVDVEGKWTVFTCGGPRARRALASAVDIDRVLQPRGCASLTLFDCPVVLVRTESDGFIVCVQSSYAANFEAAYAASLGSGLMAGSDEGSKTRSGCATMPTAPAERSDGEGVR